jgi:hypothetical protein
VICPECQKTAWTFVGGRCQACFHSKEARQELALKERIWKEGLAKQEQEIAGLQKQLDEARQENAELKMRYEGRGADVMGLLDTIQSLELDSDDMQRECDEHIETIAELRALLKSMPAPHWDQWDETGEGEWVIDDMIAYVHAHGVMSELLNKTPKADSQTDREVCKKCEEE